MSRLMIKWRHAKLDSLCKLVLDGMAIVYLAELVHGLAHPEYDALQFISQDSMSTDKVYLSVDGRSHGSWMEALSIASKVNLDTQKTEKRIRTKPKIQRTLCDKKKTDCATQRAYTRKKKVVVKENVTEDNDKSIASLSSTTYSNPHREMMRYMWQPRNYTCKNCGFTWPQHSVTISWRETCVSMCLKNKKSCTSRPEASRVEAGELWITDKHVVGNSGNNLTPTPEDTVAYAQQGKLVAINPVTRALVCVP